MVYWYSMKRMLAPVGHRRNHVSGKAVFPDSAQGRLPCRGVYAPGMTVAAQADFIVPVDLATLGLGALLNLGVFDFQPAIYHLGFLLIGTLQRQLRGVPPNA